MTADIYELHHLDAFAWLGNADERSVQAVVTDPPFGVEYEPSELVARARGGGIWRLPPAFDGASRQPLPRFTSLRPSEIRRVRTFWIELAPLLYKVMVPGAHLFVATVPVLSHLTYEALLDAKFEKRGEIVRLTSTLRGGDRPKGKHIEHANLSVLPRARWEPWGLFRKPLEGTVAANLAKWGTGALRRPAAHQPFTDVIDAGRPTAEERRIAPHPSLKPQAFLRRVIHAALPVDEGIVLDPFMGSGSTIAAATALGVRSVGVERDDRFFAMARVAIPLLAALEVPSGPESKGSTEAAGAAD